MLIDGGRPRVVTLVRWMLLSLIATFVLLVSAPRDAAAGVVPGTAYIEGGTGFIYFNSSSGGAGPASEGAVSFATGPDRYIFVDDGGMTPGTGCSAVDAFTVSCPRAAPTQVRVQIGDNAATDFNVFSTAGDFVQVIGGTGNDSLIVYSSVGNMRWVGGGGTDRLVVRDLEYTLARTTTVSWNGGGETFVARTGVGGIGYQSDVERILLLVGELAAQTVNIEMAPSWADIYVKLNNGFADIVQVSPVSGVAVAVSAAIEVEGAPTDAVLLHDVNGGAATYTILDNTVDRNLGFGGLTHNASIGQINVYGANAGAVFDVTNSTAALALFGGIAGDTLNIADDMSDLQGNVAFLPGAGSDALNVDDGGSSGPHTYTLNENVVQFSRAGSDGVSWDNATLETANLVGTNAGDTFNLNAWHPAVVVNAAGGNDAVNVRADGRKSFDGLDVDGGSGTDDIEVDNSFSGSDTSFSIDGGFVTRASGELVSFSQSETFTLLGGSAIETIDVTRTLADVGYQLNGAGGNDGFIIGPDLTDFDGALSISGGANTDGAQISDTAGPAGGSYDIRGTRFERLGSATITAGVEQVQLITTTGNDVLRLLSTISQLQVAALLGAGDDEARVFSAGLATGGASGVDGGANTDRVRLYTGGTGATFGANSILTPGKQTVSLANFEQAGTSSMSADADGDGCTDLQEIGTNPVFGGDRHPDDFFDFYNVTDPDVAIDVGDVIAILQHFGEVPAPVNEIFDRSTPDPGKLYRSAFAGNGIDIVDAIANLQSFGHNCT